MEHSGPQWNVAVMKVMFSLRLSVGVMARRKMMNVSVSVL